MPGSAEVLLSISAVSVGFVGCIGFSWGSLWSGNGRLLHPVCNGVSDLHDGGQGGLLFLIQRYE